MKNAMQLKRKTISKMVNKFGKKAHDQMKSKLQTTEFFSIQILDGA